MQIGNLSVATPVVLAPMAGVTNAPFRRLCREFATLGAAGVTTEAAAAWVNQPEDWCKSHQDGTDRGALRGAEPPVRGGGGEPTAGTDGGSQLGGYFPRKRNTNQQLDLGLYVAEMVTSRAVVERNPRALRIISFDADEYPRSAQVYGVDPKTVGQAIAIIAGESRAEHIDLNFGCPVPKVTRKGGGGALPWKKDLFAAILEAAVKAASPYQVPVTVKMRIGIDADHETYLDAGRSAVNAGIAALTLHARTVAQRYSGTANWSAIKTLKQAIPEIPVLGNGDVFSAADAAAMLAQTGCDGVVVGRGALGRPWLFADLVSAAHGGHLNYRPSLSQVADIILRHGELLTAYFNDEALACRDLRKHIGWYLRGFPVGGEARRELALIKNLSELAERLAHLPDEHYPAAADGPRGRAGSAKKPHLPYGWLDSRELNAEQACQLTEDESDTDGG